MNQLANLAPIIHYGYLVSSGPRQSLESDLVRCGRFFAALTRPRGGPGVAQDSRERKKQMVESDLGRLAVSGNEWLFSGVCWRGFVRVHGRGDRMIKSDCQHQDQSLDAASTMLKK